MTLDERIDAATAAGFGKVWVGAAPARGLVVDMLRAGFPELFADPPQAWLAPAGFESVEVPFVKIGNRRGLTYEQLRDNPHLADFVKRFPASFEQDLNTYVWLFIEPIPDEQHPHE